MLLEATNKVICIYCLMVKSHLWKIKLLRNIDQFKNIRIQKYIDNRIQASKFGMTNIEINVNQCEQSN